MPELPEVETIKRQLSGVLLGQLITDVEILHQKSWQNGDVNGLMGGRVDEIGRKGKMLIIAILNNLLTRCYLLIHLKMTGQLIYEPISELANPLISLPRVVGGHPSNSWSNSLPDRHTRIVFKLSHGTLFFNDQRLFGWVKAVDEVQLNELMSKMPPDIIDPEVTRDFFYDVLQRTNRPVKIAIMDASLIGGVGNIYANDALFDAGIAPHRRATSLSKKEADNLLKSLKRLIYLSIDLGGATAGDGKFMHTTGQGGKYQDHFLVYEQDGKVISRKNKSGVVQKFKLGGRGTYWVPELQQ